MTFPCERAGVGHRYKVSENANVSSKVWTITLWKCILKLSGNNCKIIIVVIVSKPCKYSYYCHTCYCFMNNYFQPGIQLNLHEFGVLQFSASNRESLFLIEASSRSVSSFSLANFSRHSLNNSTEVADVGTSDFCLKMFP